MSANCQCLRVSLASEWLGLGPGHLALNVMYETSGDVSRMYIVL